MSHPDLILTLTGGLAAALLLGYVTQRLGLSPIVGYLLAGIAVGPHTPGFVADEHLAEELAHIGIILLMFGVGLHFHFHELMAVRRVAIPGALGQSVAATLLGCGIAVALGWSWAAGLIFGLAVAIASTVVLLRVLADNQQLHSPTGHIAIGWLVVEDLFTVLVLVLLPVFFKGEQTDLASVAIAVGWSVLKIALLLVFIFVVGGRVIPWILERMARSHSRELFTLAILVLALGIAVGAAKLFGASMELGAFLAGMVVGRSEFSSRAAAEALPLRDAFAVLFFVSIGMLFDPVTLLAQPGLIVATLGIVLIAKPFVAFLIIRVRGYPPRTGLAVGLLLAQIGEFSFILASLGRELKILPDEATNALVATAIVSISLNPLLYRLLGLVESRARRKPRLARWLNPASALLTQDSGPNPETTDRHRVIVIGYGPVGRTLVRLLQENGFTPSIIDLNVDTVRRLRDEGLNAIYGDALNQETLHQAGCKSAVALILSASAREGNHDVIRLARTINPTIRVFARTEHLQEGAALRGAGADVVFASEGEVALSMTEYLLRQLGASAEQIDRERARVRAELFAGDLVLGEQILPAGAEPKEG